MLRPAAVRTSALTCAALLAATAALTGCGGSGGDGGGEPLDPAGDEAPAVRSTARLPAEFTGQRLDWAPCKGRAGTEGAAPPPLPDGTPWECATLKAPLDYAEPRGGTIDLAMVRAAAVRRGSGGGPRAGSLLFNFGGPGGSGVTALPAFGTGYDKLRARYDLVSFDPRGVGRSAGVTCLDDRSLDAYFAADWTPDTKAEERRLLSRQQRFADGCERHSGRVLPHIGTLDAARDMDLMRHVLGDRKLHYFGFSYGTELGAVYAHLFPRRVGRAVFDAVVDPAKSPEESALGQVKGFQLALGNYLADCAEKGADCPLGTDPDRAERGIAALLRRLDAKPLPAGGGRKLTESLAASGIAQALYSPDLWDHLSGGLKEAERDGTGRTLLMLADAMNGRDAGGRYDTLQASLLAIGCADERQRYGPDDVRTALPRFRDASPVFGPTSAWALSACDGWPVDGRWNSPDVSAEGAAPVLLVGTTGDPATPYGGTRRMKDRLGAGVGVELTYRGEGHGAYESGDRCVRGTVDAYLLRGKVPEDGKSCG
ncbi:alpha/beta hydrolase [Streptomyces armeniacus]|uniref:Alpha/beta hydrolase n=1 Tax=Streptomyces armeniacus TaxID=83291 RepID=A0A345XIT5_9ACTN|nr:alpha/beta hydrolase [Streptomyces armeniacus]AXK31551.1 alpha/beta hydrolase [Streptomyces armeniacus]